MSVSICEYLVDEAVVADVRAGDKSTLIEELAAALTADLGEGVTKRAIATLKEREELGSTGTGEGVAIPHGKLDGVPEVRLGFGRHRTGLDFDAIDEQPVHLFFFVLAPTDAPGVHLKLLARIARAARDPEVRAELLDAADRNEIKAVFRRADEEAVL